MLKQTIDKIWDTRALPALMDFIRIPCKSTAFDPHWESNGYLNQACTFISAWVKQQLPQASCEIIQEPGKTPCLWLDVPAYHAQTDNTVAFYGHLDKQPEASGWSEGLGPWTPVIRDGKLFGRGCSDDGYSVFLMISALVSLREQGLGHPHCVGIFETQEESGSIDLPHYLTALKERFNHPISLFVLDNQCCDYQRLWLNTSLRGVISAVLRVKTLHHNVHSGTYSGILPDAFAIAQHLLSRIHEPLSGRVLLDSFHTQIPENRKKQLLQAAKLLEASTSYYPPLLDGVQTKTTSVFDSIYNSTWEPALTVTAIDGLANLNQAANVVPKEIALKLSIRIPPNIDLARAIQDLEKTVTQNVPFHASVTLEDIRQGSGWTPPLTAQNQETERLLNTCSQSVFHEDVAFSATGGSISIIPEFEKCLPGTSIMLLGVLGPGSNAHGPDESLNIEYVKKLTNVLSLYLKDVA